MAMHHLQWDDDPLLINNYPENDFACTKSHWKKSPKKDLELHFDFQLVKSNV